MKRESVEYTAINDGDIKKIADAKLEDIESQLVALSFSIAVADEILSFPEDQVTVEQRNAVTQRRASDARAYDQLVVTWEAMQAVLNADKPAKKRAA